MPTPSLFRPSNEELRALYLDQRLSSVAIARRCNVEKITVLRWLKAAGVERRPAGRGLLNRGTAIPTADELRDLVQVRHLPYAEIAALFGVDPSAVPYWLRQHSIPSPERWVTRRRGRSADEPSEQELRARIIDGESLGAIAEDFAVCASTLRNRCRDYGIEVRPDGWDAGKRHICSDGHLARSTYELRVDDWLTEHGVPHEVEPTYPWDRRYRADFRVDEVYVEVWGVTNNPAYSSRRAMKIARCESEGIDLIQINSWQFKSGRRWWRSLERLQDVGSGVSDPVR